MGSDLKFGAPSGEIGMTASAQLEQNRECPHGTSATLSPDSIKHTSLMSSDAATAVTVEVAIAGRVELTTGSWLLASASVPLSSSDVTWRLESLGVTVSTKRDT